jgi:hypothetical protein
MFPPTGVPVNVDDLESSSALPEALVFERRTNTALAARSFG